MHAPLPTAAAYVCIVFIYYLVIFRTFTPLKKKMEIWLPVLEGSVAVFGGRVAKTPRRPKPLACRSNVKPLAYLAYAPFFTGRPVYLEV